MSKKSVQRLMHLLVCFVRVMFTIFISISEYVAFFGAFTAGYC